MSEPEIAYEQMTRNKRSRAQNADPMTGRVLPRVRPDIEDNAKTFDAPVEAVKEVIDTSFKPIRVWTGGPGTPQEKIYTTKPGGIRPYRDYAYYCKTQAEASALKRALGGKFWIDTVPADEPSPRCDVCGWTCRSYAAMNYHQNTAHGRPQD